MNIIKILSGKNRYLNYASIHFLIICLLSCSKSHMPVNNNEVNATITYSSGATVNIHAKAFEAGMGSLGGVFSTGTYVSARSDTKLFVSINTFSPVSADFVVTSPGTYSCSGIYRLNHYDPRSQTYENPGVNTGHRKAGSVTFTAIDDSHMEGFFNVMCWDGVDSVVIAGTFKGNHLQ